MAVLISCLSSCIFLNRPSVLLMVNCSPYHGLLSQQLSFKNVFSSYSANDSSRRTFRCMDYLQIFNVNLLGSCNFLHILLFLLIECCHKFMSLLESFLYFDQILNCLVLRCFQCQVKSFVYIQKNMCGDLKLFCSFVSLFENWNQHSFFSTLVYLF